MSRNIIELSKKFTRNHLVLCSIGLFSLRAGLFGASIGDSIFFLSVFSLLGYKEYLESLKKVDINQETLKEVNDLRNIVSGINMKSAVKSPEQPQFKRYF